MFNWHLKYSHINYELLELYHYYWCTCIIVKLDNLFEYFLVKDIKYTFIVEFKKYDLLFTVLNASKTQNDSHINYNIIFYYCALTDELG